MITPPTYAENQDSFGGLMVVVGETSGDHHAAPVVKELLRRAPSLPVYGMGGSHLRAAGMETVVDSEQAASVMGLTEVLAKAGTIVDAFKRLVRLAKERKPTVVLLVDYPDFNLRLAKRLHTLGIKVVYFVTPQVWAWRTGRVKIIKRYVDQVLPIIPFEEPFYHAHGVPARYVGHPFIDRPALSVSSVDFLKQVGVSDAVPLVGILPGSRTAEIERLLSVMLDAFALLRQRRPGIQALLPIAENLDFDQIAARVRERNIDGIQLVRGRAREVLASSTVAMVASGTATVEAALERVPFVLVYRLSPITFFFGKLLVRNVRFVGMVNLIAGHKVVEELLQERATAEEIAIELERLLGDPSAVRQMRAEFDRVELALRRGMNGESGPGAEGCAGTVASVILGYFPGVRANV